MKVKLALCFIVAVGLCACDRAQKNTETDNLLRRITQLEKETERLQSVRDIKKLQRAYGYYLSQHLWSDAADLYAEDGTIEFAQRGVAQGKDSVHEFLLGLSDGREGIRFGELDEHMLLQPVVHVSDDGNSASGRWRAFIWSGQYQQHAEWRAGIYQNEYTKLNGVWQIKRTRWIPTIDVDYADGWAAGKISE